ncbi:FAD-dependent oxidoreductase domain-containing protein 2 [Lingula anatina]|uniref:FAD-dependent oxidoreductase domain-containing protein 2 n=1 Tax=Lingula anatina TaxID=7574 RepID=A0A1S3HSN1_LINAN|nr:FAD-dependent oxidoreductase domain-containing protein 2 [Lingula anatina]XP_013388557.1 FAD-dependent oxidoreductase domain-containing protein 2 [Lingula anatina]|eukprot:XP_013388556.1 FAD-dependent oxidoreductase domain-containing protein 2 [Lingula anatina]
MSTNIPGFLSKCVLLVLLCLVSGSSQNYHEYCIVGAGPGGLQLGYFLQTSNRDYVIFERNNVSGSFFTKYPRHDMVISLNKRNTGRSNKEYNLRHDWNSLISHDESLQVRHYSKVMFPHREVLVKYLDDYQRKLGINVQYNVDVHNIRKHSDTGLFSMEDQRGNAYSCKNLIMATGMQKANVPKFPGYELAVGYEDVSVDPEDFEGKSVLILGRGNSAFEVAERIYGVTNNIFMLGRSRIRLSWSTHYVGDLRAVNNGLLDTYQLKALDAIIEAPAEEVNLLKQPDGKIRLELRDKLTGFQSDNFIHKGVFDTVVRCTGWTFDKSPFHNSTIPEMGRGRKKKYPNTDSTYESTNIPGLFFAGTNAHSVDFRKSAGGFIHGFRYTARTLYHYLEHRNHGVEWPSIKAPITELLDRILKRINEASGIYQMFQVLGDVILLKNGGKEFEYLEEYPIKSLHKLTEVTGKTADRLLVVVLEYGANFSGPAADVFRTDRALGDPATAHLSNLLHPALYLYEKLPSEEDMATIPKHLTLPRPASLFYLIDDAFITWDAPYSHIFELRRFLEKCMDTDMRKYFASSCFTLAMTHQTVPLMCQEKYMQGQGLVGTEALLNRVRGMLL